MRGPKRNKVKRKELDDEAQTRSCQPHQPPRQTNISPLNLDLGIYLTFLLSSNIHHVPQTPPHRRPPRRLRPAPRSSSRGSPLHDQSRVHRGDRHAQASPRPRPALRNPLRRLRRRQPPGPGHLADVHPADGLAGRPSRRTREPRYPLLTRSTAKQHAPAAGVPRLCPQTQCSWHDYHDGLHGDPGRCVRGDHDGQDGHGAALPNPAVEETVSEDEAVG